MQHYSRDYSGITRDLYWTNHLGPVMFVKNSSTRGVNGRVPKKKSNYPHFVDKGVEASSNVDIINFEKVDKPECEYY